MPCRSRARIAFLVAADGKGTRETWPIGDAYSVLRFFQGGARTGRARNGLSQEAVTLKELVERGVVDAGATDRGIAEFPSYDHIGLKTELPGSYRYGKLIYLQITLEVQTCSRRVIETPVRE